MAAEKLIRPFVLAAPDPAAWAFPDVATPAEIGDDEPLKPPVSRVALFEKTGKFRHPRSGRFTITRQVFESFRRNFSDGIPTSELAFDFDHAPEYAGDTRACGWIRALHAEGDALYATVAWNWAGAWAIREDEYRYVSPTFHMAFVSDDETKRGPVLLGAALTNRPFLEQQAGIRLSRDLSDDELLTLANAEQEDEDLPDPSDSRPRMELTAEIREQLGVAEDADEQAVLAAVAGLADNQPGEDQVVLSKADHDELERKATAASESETEATTLATRVDDLQEKLDAQEFNALFSAAMGKGKVGDADREDHRAWFDADRERYARLVESLPEQVNTASRGGRGEGHVQSDEDYHVAGAVDEDALKLHQRTEAIAAEKGIDYGDAAEFAMAEVSA